MLQRWGPWCLLFFVLAGAARVEARPKTDTIWTDKGDRVVCEILELKQGQLRVGTNDMGTLTIDWLHIVSLRSNYFFRVEPRSGRRYFGSLLLDSAETILQVRRYTDTLRFRRWDVVAITPIETGFWSRLDGSFALGFSYTKASRVAQLTLNWNNRYTMESDLVDLKANAIATSKDDSSDVLRNEDFSLAYYHLFGKRLNASLSGAYQRNDELGLKRRTIAALTGGVSPIKTNLHTLMFSLGAALNAELGTSDSSVATESVEGVVKLNYSLYKYDSPKSNIAVTLAYFPSLTENDRHRLDFNTTFSHELVSDFFLNLSYYTNLDTKPATQDASTSDFGVVTSFSWSY